MVLSALFSVLYLPRYSPSFELIVPKTFRNTAVVVFTSSANAALRAAIPTQVEQKADTLLAD